MAARARGYFSSTRWHCSSANGRQRTSLSMGDPAQARLRASSRSAGARVRGGPRSALEWLIDRYRVKKDRASGIVNDVNDWGLEMDPPNPRYIVDLVKRIVTVSVETVATVNALPPLEEAERAGRRSLR